MFRGRLSPLGGSPRDWLAALWPYQAEVVTKDNGLRTITQLELVKDVLHVGLHRALGQNKVVRDLPVGAAPCDELQDFSLPIGQRFQAHGVRSLRGCLGRELVDEA